MDFISKMAASKMGQLRLELVELNERLEAATDEEQIRKLRKTIQEKEVYYNILATGCGPIRGISEKGGCCVSNSPFFHFPLWQTERSMV